MMRVLVIDELDLPTIEADESWQEVQRWEVPGYDPYDREVQDGDFALDIPHHRSLRFS